MSRREDDPYIAEIEDELREVYEVEDPAIPSGPVEWLFAVVGFIAAAIWFLIRFAVPIVVLIGVVGALTGAFDKEEVREDRNSPGWEMVRDLRNEGAIDEFKAVKPDEGWQWQYELDFGTDLRFRRSGDTVEMEYETTSPSLGDEIGEAAKKHGFVGE